MPRHYGERMLFLRSILSNRSKDVKKAIPLAEMAFAGCFYRISFSLSGVLAAGASGVVATGHGRPLDAFLVGGAVSVLSMCTDAVLLRLLGDPNE